MVFPVNIRVARELRTGVKLLAAVKLRELDAFALNAARARLRGLAAAALTGAARTAIPIKAVVSFCMDLIGRTSRETYDYEHQEHEH